jgi:osmotically-inducible protein OsmY
MVIHKTSTELEDSVKDKLAFEPEINDSKIYVSARGSVITLFGSVSSFYEKNAAERAVRSVVGVKGVANELQVDLAAKYKRTDTDIATAAVEALKWDVAVPEDAIQISVENGQVTLTGNVDWWYQKSSAEKAVRNLIGVKNINNQINIHPGITVKDVKMKIMEEFHRNASIDAAKINVEIEGNRVILKGNVRSWLEMQEAIKAVRSIPGVTQIDNDLVIID